MAPDEHTLLRFDADAIADASALHAPGSILLEVVGELAGEAPGAANPRRATILAAGPAAHVSSHAAAASARVFARPGCILIPGLVNAHTHLDLTHIGPVPASRDPGFMPFIEAVRAGRRTRDDLIEHSVRLGIGKSLAGGVVAVGDIAGCPSSGPTLAACRALAASPLRGTSFLEFFAIGAGERPGLARLAAALAQAPPAGADVRLGLQPHAPYSVSPAGYLAALDTGLPLSTHLSENQEELDLIADAAGPNRAFLESLGLWDDSLLAFLGHARSPIEHLQPILSRRPFLAAHVNHASDADLDILAASRTAVAYCPRASAYFRAEQRFGPHRYRDMLARGIPVALGTDSVLNLPDARRLSTLDEMRLLYRRDATDPLTLLRMATLNAAAALALDRNAFLFKPGARVAGIVAIPVPGARSAKETPLAAALLAGSDPELLLLQRRENHPQNTPIA